MAEVYSSYMSNKSPTKKRVYNADIAHRLWLDGYTSENATGNHIEAAYDDLREEAGNPQKVLGHWTATAQAGLGDDRWDKIIDALAAIEKEKADGED